MLLPVYLRTLLRTQSFTGIQLWVSSLGKRAGTTRRFCSPLWRYKTLREH